MSDNTTLNTNTTSGDVIASDDCAGVKYQRVKLTDGTADSTTVIAAGGGVEAGALRVTIASDSTGVLSVDDNGGNLSIDDGGNSITVDNGGTFAVQATIAAGATNIAKAEDAAHSSGDVGVPALAVRQDTAASLAGTDADYQPLITDASGRLWVNASGAAVPVTDNSGSLTVDNGGTFSVQASSVVPGTAATELGKAEDAAHSSGDTGVMVLAVREAAATDLSAGNTDGDYEPLQVDASGRLWVNASGAAVPVTDNSGSLTVDNGGTFAVQVTSVVAGTSATSLGKAEDAAHSSGDTGVMALSVRQDTAAALAGTDADYQPLITDASGRLHVNVGNTVTVGSHAVTNAGTFAVQVDGSALTSLQLIDDPVIADDAAFTPATSKVMMAGFEYDDTTPDSVDEGDAGAARMSARREVYVQVRDAAGNERGLNVDASGRIGITDGSGSLTVDNAGTFAVQESGAALTALQLIDNLVLAEDAAHQSGDPGVQALSVRKDTAAAVGQTDGDYQPLITDANGRLHVLDQNSAAIAASLSVLDDWDSSDRCMVNPIVGQAGVAAGAGATGATVQRVVQANDAGKTIVSKAGTAASSGNNALVSAGTNRLKVSAFSLSTTSTTAVTCIFQDGASGTALWQVILQAGPDTSTGANLAVPFPSWLFATSSATLLNLNLSGAITVHYSLTYVDEA